MTCFFCDHEFPKDSLYDFADHFVDAHRFNRKGYTAFECPCGPAYYSHYLYLVAHWQEHNVTDHASLLCHLVLD